MAVAMNVDIDQVRRMVVATSIDAGLQRHYQDRYEIESFEVSL